MREQNISRNHLDRRLDGLRPIARLHRPPRGWVRAIRDALGMTAQQLGHRMGVSQPRIFALEHGEIEGTLTLTSLERAAEALDCTLVYALIPNKPLEDLVQERARTIATEQLARVDHTMRLENQALEADALVIERDRLINELANHPRRLWD